MNSDDAFTRAALYQSCKKSKILNHIDVENADLQTLRHLVNKYNSLSIRELPVIISKLATKAALEFITDKIPKMKGYIDPKNISVRLEDDELAYLQNTESNFKPNLYVLVIKNLAVSVLGTSIAAFKQQLVEGSGSDNGAGNNAANNTNIPRDYRKINVASVSEDLHVSNQPKQYTDFPNYNGQKQRLTTLTPASAATSDKKELSRSSHQTPNKLAVKTRTSPKINMKSSRATRSEEQQAIRDRKRKAILQHHRQIGEISLNFEEDSGEEEEEKENHDNVEEEEITDNESEEESAGDGKEVVECYSAALSEIVSDDDMSIRDGFREQEGSIEQTLLKTIPELTKAQEDQIGSLDIRYTKNGDEVLTGYQVRDGESSNTSSEYFEGGIEDPVLEENEEDETKKSPLTATVDMLKPTLLNKNSDDFIDMVTAEFPRDYEGNQIISDAHLLKPNVKYQISRNDQEQLHVLGDSDFEDYLFTDD